MANILFLILPYPGCLAATLDLAERLRARGHAVSYLGMADSEEAVCAQGFSFTPLFERRFPKGFYAETEALESLPFGLASLRAQRRFIARLHAFAADLQGESGEEFRLALQRLAPDLVIFASTDLWIEWTAFIAHAAGVKSIYFHDSLTSSAKSGLPPIFTALIPDGGLLSRFRIAAAWRWFALQIKLQSWLLRPLGLDLDFEGVRRRLAAHCGYRLSRADHDRKAPRLTELVAWPIAFEFPGAETAERHYVGASIHRKRREPPFPWNRLDAQKPLVYCAMGTLVFSTKETYRRFFQAVVDLARSRPERQWVIAIGAAIDPEDLRDVPADVVIVRQAPQLQLLQRAHLMITHGGANTVKECIAFGVPMVSFPLGCDHPGNSARLVFQGLGLRADIQKASAPYLGRLIDALEADEGLRPRMKAMQASFQALEEAETAPRMVEAILRGESLDDP
ncbi:nucleotide disphospho-sugar-binding domain-containing protein [Methylocapsa aurea]|uniref:nucleotide disphospho-sugar-binding domain-containing protein n=1 Tax=Methylocapsa aurea TaxID=663610 RepID=UPI00055C60DF|nr:nucleotide disphospho-sugar-binding domain-containing protein [Methylocapsa aurea]